MKINIQTFGGRGASSSSNTEPKSATFTTAIYNADMGGRQDIEVKGVDFKYKSIDVGVFNTTQEAYASNNPSYFGRGTDKYIAVVRTDNEANGTMLTRGKTRKEAIANAKDLIDKRRKDILRAMGRAK